MVADGTAYVMMTGVAFKFFNLHVVPTDLSTKSNNLDRCMHCGGYRVLIQPLAVLQSLPASYRLAGNPEMVMSGNAAKYTG